MTSTPLKTWSSLGNLFVFDRGVPWEHCGSSSTEPIGVRLVEMLEVFSDSGEKKSGREYKTKNRFDDISSIVWLFIGMENAGRLYPLLRSVTGVGSEGEGMGT